MPVASRQAETTSRFAEPRFAEPSSGQRVRGGVRIRTSFEIRSDGSHCSYCGNLVRQARPIDSGQPDAAPLPAAARGLQELLLEARWPAEQAIGRELVHTYHAVGRRLLEEKAAGPAAYGTAIMQRLADDIALSVRNLQLPAAALVEIVDPRISPVVPTARACLRGRCSSWPPPAHRLCLGRRSSRRRLRGRASAEGRSRSMPRSNMVAG